MLEKLCTDMLTAYTELAKTAEYKNYKAKKNQTIQLTFPNKKEGQIVKFNFSAISAVIAKAELQKTPLNSQTQAAIDCFKARQICHELPVYQTYKKCKDTLRKAVAQCSLLILKSHSRETDPDKEDVKIIATVLTKIGPLNKADQLIKKTHDQTTIKNMTQKDISSWPIDPTKHTTDEMRTLLVQKMKELDFFEKTTQQ